VAGSRGKQKGSRERYESGYLQNAGSLPGIPGPFFAVADSRLYLDSSLFLDAEDLFRFLSRGQD
jgi:hypothetical protein